MSFLLKLFAAAMVIIGAVAVGAAAAEAKKKRLVFCEELLSDTSRLASELDVYKTPLCEAVIKVGHGDYFKNLSENICKGKTLVISSATAADSAIQSRLLDGEGKKLVTGLFSSVGGDAEEQKLLFRDFTAAFSVLIDKERSRADGAAKIYRSLGAAAGITAAIMLI